MSVSVPLGTRTYTSSVLAISRSEMMMFDAYTLAKPSQKYTQGSCQSICPSRENASVPSTNISRMPSVPALQCIHTVWKA